MNPTTPSPNHPRTYHHNTSLHTLHLKFKQIHNEISGSLVMPILDLSTDPSVGSKRSLENSLLSAAAQHEVVGEKVDELLLSTLKGTTGDALLAAVAKQGRTEEVVANYDRTLGGRWTKKRHH